MSNGHRHAYRNTLRMLGTFVQAGFSIKKHGDIWGRQRPPQACPGSGGHKRFLSVGNCRASELSDDFGFCPGSISGFFHGSCSCPLACPDACPGSIQQQRYVTSRRHVRHCARSLVCCLCCINFFCIFPSLYIFPFCKYIWRFDYTSCACHPHLQSS